MPGNGAAVGVIGEDGLWREFPIVSPFGRFGATVEPFLKGGLGSIVCRLVERTS